MTYRRPSRWLKGQAAATFDSRSSAQSGPTSGHPVADWRESARELGRRLVPAMVLIGAGVLGLAAVAIT